MTERDDVARRIMGDTCEVFTESPGWEDAHFETFSWCELHNPGAWPEYLTEEGEPVARTWLGGINAGVCHAAAAAADGILALLPEPTKPNRDDLRGAFHAQGRLGLCECGDFVGGTEDFVEHWIDNLLRLLPGRTENEIKAEALREYGEVAGKNDADVILAWPDVARDVADWITVFLSEHADKHHPREA